MKTLFAGPFVGEFGWELFCWQGILRQYVEISNFDNVIISGRKSTEFLYRDFCNEYIPYEPDIYEPDSYFNRGKMTNIPQPPSGCTYIPYNHRLTHYTPAIKKGESIWNPKMKQSFIKYGNKIDTDIKILIHSRDTAGAGGITSIRNWDTDKFEKIVNHYNNIKFASIGTKSASNYIKGTEDLRDKDIIDYMASADLIIGPSSGPMHLASLCGLKHLAWGVENNINRYKYDWNPHNTEMDYIVSEDWNPDVDNVILKMESLL
tara:strand:- start:625 stop:1410 length:786 start_codon:yes stop_codon:yes gene_type:complete